MNWQEQVLFKMDVSATELAELRRWLIEKDIPEQEASHMLRGHLRNIQMLALKRMPMAYALDNSDLLLRYEGTLSKGGAAPISKMSRLFSNLRDQIINLAKSHGQISAHRSRWPQDLDLVVTACTPDLTFGVSLPDLTQSTKSQKQLTLLDPAYTALRDSLDFMGAVTASLQQEDPMPALRQFATDHGTANADEYFIDTGLIAARKLIPSRASGNCIERVEIGGRVVGNRESVYLDRENWDRANRILREKNIPKDTLELTGYLMEVDYEVMRLHLRQLSGWKVASVRCSYSPEQEDFVKKHGKKKIWVKGNATFNRDGEPTLLVIEDMKAGA